MPKKRKEFLIYGKWQWMSKYNFDLDMSGDNSNSIILRQVGNNSRVLEFGPAHGRMTKYLKEQLNCKVTIIELDEEAGTEAKSYANRSFIGENGNIENYKWLKIKTKFDYIIFADVLEHLYDPLKVLSSAKSLLKENGKILISIPNISHNSVLIDLLNNKFIYRSVGLLDNTHIRFFTRSSLEKLVESAGLTIDKINDASNAVEYTEFNNSYNDIPDSVAEFLRNKKDGNVYQFIWTLKCGN